MSKASPQAVNRLLAALPDVEYQRLVPHLERVPLSLKQVLYKAGESIEYVYFPDRAVVSLISTSEENLMVEIGLVGNEGIVGIPAVLGDSIAMAIAMVQVAGFGIKMKASLLKTEFQRGDSLQSLLLLYTQALYALVSQAAACNGIHRLDERLARWLLLMCERVDSNELLLTQELISKLLGVRRAGVTEAANSLQRAGIIRYSRGIITILNRQELEAASCPCYKIIKGEYTRLFGTEQS
jgi:CRP-like cAMP-binding protein